MVSSRDAQSKKTRKSNSRRTKTLHVTEEAVKIILGTRRIRTQIQLTELMFKKRRRRSRFNLRSKAED